MDEVFTISAKELQRHSVLEMVSKAQITLVRASSLMNVSYRHAKRLKKAHDADGVRALAHQNRGRPPANKTDEGLRERIVELSKKVYADFNDTHFTEMLRERECFAISRETVRLIRRQEAIRPKRKRRAPVHHRRRPRKPCEGLMMLWDGSPHHWFGIEHEPCCMMGAVDDATGKALGLLFCEHECSAAYLELLGRVVRRYGVPASVYQDRHSALARNDDNWSIEEQLAGKQEPTQVGAALDALGIEPIFAKTPQAKGRVERLFGTIQDRLPAMLALEQITDIKPANAYIDEFFLDYYNDRFAQQPLDAHSAWRKLHRGADLDKILSLRYEATVANDNAIRFDKMLIDVPPGPGNRSYAGARAELRQLLDGSWKVYYQDKLIACAPPTELAEPIRAKRRRKGVRAGVDYQWVYLASKTQAEPPHSTAHEAKPTLRRAGPGTTIRATRIA